MKITKRAKVAIGAVALTGSVLAVGGAFTATGIDRGVVPENQFLGGTVTQTISGAEMSSVAYTFADEANTLVSSIAIGFTNGNADGATLALTPSGTGPGTFSCGDVAAGASTCTFVPATAETGYLGLTGISIEVGNVQS